MNDKISQDTINKALWAACDTFRGTISADKRCRWLILSCVSMNMWH